MLQNTIDRLRARGQPSAEVVKVGESEVPLAMLRHPRARRYLLRLLPNGTARVTIPRSGNHADALRFVERNRSWLESQLQGLAEHPTQREEWKVGTHILMHGERVRIDAPDSGLIAIGNERIRVAAHATDLRPVIERHLWRLAKPQLSTRVMELSSIHGFTVQHVCVRNQRTRWGSCSRRGTISLNWRLIQTPGFVRDYIVLHELAHLREMNHSHRFWTEVERLCPDYREAERWLKLNRGLLR